MVEFVWSVLFLFEIVFVGWFLFFGIFFLVVIVIFLKFLELLLKKDLFGVLKYVVLVWKVLKKIFCKSFKFFLRLFDKVINRG